MKINHRIQLSQLMHCHFQLWLWRVSRDRNFQGHWRWVLSLTSLSSDVTLKKQLTSRLWVEGTWSLYYPPCDTPNGSISCDPMQWYCILSSWNVYCHLLVVYAVMWPTTIQGIVRCTTTISDNQTSLWYMYSDSVFDNHCDLLI